MPKHKPKQRTHTAYLQCLECEQVTERKVILFNPFPRKTVLECGCEEGARHVDADTGFDLMVQGHIESGRNRRKAA